MNTQYNIPNQNRDITIPKVNRIDSIVVICKHINNSHKYMIKCNLNQWDSLSFYDVGYIYNRIHLPHSRVLVVQSTGDS